MKSRALPLLIGLVVMACSVSAADKDGIAIDLKKCKFKVDAKVADLFGYNQDEGKLYFYTNGAAEVTVAIPEDAEYTIVVKASCDSAQNERAKFKLSIDGKAVGEEVKLTADEAKEYTIATKLKKGDCKLALEFTNDAFKEGEFDRNLYVHAITLKKK